MVVSAGFIAIDWGTTNRRAYHLVDGAVAARARDDRGILAVGPGGFEAEIAELRARWGGAPMLLAGMVGSNRGWVDAGYVPCPAGLADLAAAVVSPMAGVRIVPGVSLIAEGRVDVMRGEEVQLLGAAAAALVPEAALLCQPGTHSKWARVERGAIIDFTTAMTGELFALLRGHALIGHAMSGEATVGPTFREGVRDAGDGDLLARLFGVRPASLLGLRDDRDAASYVSGLLIGADCRARMTADAAVQLLAEGALADLYTAAVEMLGGRAHRIDSEAAFVAGAQRLWEMLP